MITLETERLLLRRFRPDDWQDLYAYLSDEAVVRYEPYGVFSEEECRDAAIRRSRQDAFWAVCLRGSGRLIGNVYFQRQEPADFLTWEIGYVFNPAYGGKGYATESCRKVIDYAFSELGARRVIARCNPENARSWRLIERLGMRREGHLRKNSYHKRDGQGRPIWHDSFEYAILAEEWAKAATD